MILLAGFFQIKEAAEYLGVTTNTLRNWQKKGKIRAHRNPMNNYRLYKIEDLNKILDAARIQRG